MMKKLLVILLGVFLFGTIGALTALALHAEHLSYRYIAAINATALAATTGYTLFGGKKAKSASPLLVLSIAFAFATVFSCMEAGINFQEERARRARTLSSEKPILCDFKGVYTQGDMLGVNLYCGREEFWWIPREPKKISDLISSRSQFALSCVTYLDKHADCQIQWFAPGG